MSAMLELSIYPVAQGQSISPYVARCVQIIERSGLEYRLGPMGTTIEGQDIHELLGLVEQCLRALEDDCPRVEANVKIDMRRGDGSHMDDRLASVEAKVGHKLKT